LVRGGTSYLNHVRIVPGGSGNVSVGMSLLGARTAFIGKAGTDMLGGLYVEDLKKNNVSPEIYLDDELPTGFIIVLVEEEGERSFLVYRGANDKLNPEEIEESRSVIKDSKYLYICGYSLTHPCQRSAILTAVEIARTHGAKVVFDPAAYNLVQSQPDLFRELLECSDIFCPNEQEAMAMTGAATLEQAIERLRESTKLVALKLGDKGSVLINNKETIRIPAFKVRSVDPTGAGDAFTAALIYGLTHNLSLNHTACLATWYGAEATTDYGARSFPAEDEILSFLKALKSGHLDSDSSCWEMWRDMKV